MKKFRAIVAVMVLLLMVLSIPVSAHGTGKSYVYDQNVQATEIPDPYAVVDTIGYDLGLVAPVDMVVLDDKLFILDAGVATDASTACVYILNKDYTPYVGEQDGTSFIPAAVDGKLQFRDTSSGSAAYVQFTEPKGLWVVNNGTVEEPDYQFYIADRLGHKIYVFDCNGMKINEFGKPDTPMMQDISDEEYLPTKILTDHLGIIYIRVENDYRGFVMLEPDGTFLGYFGSNEVTRTAEAVMLRMFSAFMTEEQLKNSKQLLPMEYSNFCIDKEGDFIYGVRGTTSNMTELIRKLNCKSKNVLDYKGIFGDFTLTAVNGQVKNTNFNAVTVDENGFITAFDATWQRLFQYTPEGHLMYIFGGQGTQQGTFMNGIDIESWGNKLLILDGKFATITVMEPTAFGSNVRQGEIYYSQGNYEASLAPFQAVVAECMNYEFGYAGIGKALYMQRDYKAAMDCFYLGNDWVSYSMAFKMYRGEVMRDLTVPVLIGVVVLVLVLVVVKVLKKKGIIKTRKLVLDESGKGKYVLHTILHPIEGFEEMRYNKKDSLLFANIAIFFFFFSNVISALYSGFIFNGITAETYNVLFTIVGTLGAFSLFVLVNWLMSTFFEGKGTFKRVWTYLGYATIPYSITCFLYTALSNVLVQEEGTFLYYLIIFGEGWSLVMVFFALMGAHMYSFKRNVVSILVTILGMLVVIFIIFLMFNLFVQFFSFVESIITELMYRSAVGF